MFLNFCYFKWGCSEVLEHLPSGPRHTHFLFVVCFETVVLFVSQWPGTQYDAHRLPLQRPDPLLPPSSVLELQVSTTKPAYYLCHREFAYRPFLFLEFETSLEGEMTQRERIG